MRDASLAGGRTGIRAGRWRSNRFNRASVSARKERMLYMVIERFKDPPAIYRRLREKGRMMPEGLEYVSSWIDVDLKTCWQLMRSEDESLFEHWTDNWKDLMEFKIVPVRTSDEVRRLMEKHL
jgi:hypothetical protein